MLCGSGGQTRVQVQKVGFKINTQGRIVRRKEEKDVILLLEASSITSIASCDWSVNKPHLCLCFS